MAKQPWAPHLGCTVRRLASASLGLVIAAFRELASAGKTMALVVALSPLGLGLLVVCTPCLSEEVFEVILSLAHDPLLPTLHAQLHLVLNSPHAGTWSEWRYVNCSRLTLTTWMWLLGEQCKSRLETGTGG